MNESGSLLNKRMARHAAIIAFGVIASFAALQCSGAEEVVEETSAFSSADLEPSVRIEQHENRTVEEFSVNDNVYMIKITPKYGAPYTLIDPNGNGEMEWRRDTLGAEVTPPSWTLFSW
jgi:hypothetical protein